MQKSHKCVITGKTFASLGSKQHVGTEGVSTDVGPVIRSAITQYDQLKTIAERMVYNGGLKDKPHLVRRQLVKLLSES